MYLKKKYWVICVFNIEINDLKLNYVNIDINNVENVGMYV